MTAAAQPVTPASATPSAAASITFIDQAKAKDVFPVASKPDPSLLEEETQQNDQNRRGSSKSDDDDMVPAQSRRKAQNRAAYVLTSWFRPSSKQACANDKGRKEVADI